MHIDTLLWADCCCLAGYRRTRPGWLVLVQAAKAMLELPGDLGCFFFTKSSNG